MQSVHVKKWKTLGLGVSAVTMLAACDGGGSSDGNTLAAAPALPQLAPAVAANYSGDCSAIPAQLTGLANTRIISATTVAASVLNGAATGEHCLVTGAMNERFSPVDGNNYAIGFEMRIPKNWNGRFFYQANGGLDGVVRPAVGQVSGQTTASSSALSKGFAVLSSDAGHPQPTPFFGLDPQARLDYGYNAVAQLTPMAKNLLKAVYGKAPDRSYFGGCSNGGRHTMVAAARFSDQYDGFLAGDPGFNLPKAAVAQLWGAQQYATLATSTVTVPDNGSGTPVALPDINTAFSPGELNLVSAKIIEKCDALDGVVDGQVSDLKACQTAFNVSTAVPTCSGGPNARDGATCLSANQKTVLANVFAGARNSAGNPLYSSFPFDAGINTANWRMWKLAFSVQLDPGSVGFDFTTPPQTNTKTFSGLPFALSFNVDTDAPKIFATNATYPVASMTFMTPPDPTNLALLKNRGAKMLVYHGTSDPIFSYNDTANWYEGLRTANNGDASNFARLYAVPGMNHCSEGPAADSFDMLAPLVDWVEQGKAPASITAQVRGPGHVSGANTELPANWSPTRSRPLCPYPQVARYKGTGSTEDAANFSCSI